VIGLLRTAAAARRRAVPTKRSNFRVSISADVAGVKSALDELLVLAERSERAREVIKHALSGGEGRAEAFWYQAESDPAPRAGDVLLRLQPGEGLRDLLAAARAAERAGE
jgi:hypothetical protein